jgi:hypothetical protein
MFQILVEVVATVFFEGLLRWLGVPEPKIEAISMRVGIAFLMLVIVLLAGLFVYVWTAS